ncbi:MAG: helix-turn-helix domain-containing protein [Dehalococcoidia bacterium]|nr:helix-turn-helix domain-containing protein [Dehalococcoidia bacterium]
MNENELTVDQVARELHLSPRRVRDLLHGGKLRGQKLGGRNWFVPLGEVRRYAGIKPVKGSGDAGQPLEQQGVYSREQQSSSPELHQKYQADALLDEWRVLYSELPPTPFQMVSAIMEADNQEKTPPPPLVLGPTNARFNYASGIKDLVDLPESNSGQRVGVREWEPKRADYVKAHLRATPKGTNLLRDMERRRKLWWAYLHRCKELRFRLRAEASEKIAYIPVPESTLGKATDYGNEWDKRVLVMVAMIEARKDPDRFTYADSSWAIIAPTHEGLAVVFWQDPRLLDALHSLLDPIYKESQGELLFQLWRCVRSCYSVLSRPSEPLLEEEIVALVAKGRCSLCEEEKGNGLLEGGRYPPGKEVVQSHVDMVLRGAWAVENALRELRFADNGDCMARVVNDPMGKRWPIPMIAWGSWERGEVPEVLPMLQSFGQHFPALAEDVQGWLAQVDRRGTERMGASHDGTRDVLLEASKVLARTLLDVRLRGRLPVGSACQWC